MSSFEDQCTISLALYENDTRMYSFELVGNYTATVLLVVVSRWMCVADDPRIA